MASFGESDLLQARQWIFIGTYAEVSGHFPGGSGVYCMLRGVVSCNLIVALNSLSRRSPRVLIRYPMPAAFHFTVWFRRYAS